MEIFYRTALTLVCFKAYLKSFSYPFFTFWTVQFSVFKLSLLCPALKLQTTLQCSLVLCTDLWKQEFIAVSDIVCAKNMHICAMFSYWKTSVRNWKPCFPLKIIPHRAFNSSMLQKSPVRLSNLFPFQWKISFGNSLTFQGFWLVWFWNDEAHFPQEISLYTQRFLHKASNIYSHPRKYFSEFCSLILLFGVHYCILEVICFHKFLT